MKYRKKLPIIGILLLCMFLVWGFVLLPDTFALNEPGNKAVNACGYKYDAGQNSITVFFDKNVAGADTEQFKLFKGDSKSGDEIKFSEAVFTREPFVSGVSGLSGGACIKLTPEEELEPNSTYTLVISSTIKANNGFTLGYFYFNKDVVYHITTPDTDGKYKKPIVVDVYPENGTKEVPLEGNIDITVDRPVKNFEEVKNGLVLKKNGVPMVYDYTIDTEKHGDIYAPLVIDARTCFFFTMTGGGAAFSYDFDPDATYTLEIPQIIDMDDNTLEKQTIEFSTTKVDIPNAKLSAPSVIPEGDNLKISWSPIGENIYNVYASNDKYFNYTKINAEPVTDTTFVTSGLQPGEYYFRITAVNEGGEGGYSYDGSGVITDVTKPVWASDSILEISNIDLKNGSVTLKWPSALDDVGVTQYKIYQDGVVVGTVQGNSFEVTGLELNKTYTFKVTAGDAEGNWSTDLCSSVMLLTDGLVSGSSSEVSIVKSTKPLPGDKLFDPVEITRQNGSDPVVVSFKFLADSLPKGIKPGQVSVYKWIDGRWVIQPSIVSFDDLGNYTVSFTAETFSTFTVLADTEPPNNVSITKDNVTPTSVTVQLSASDALSGVKGFNIYAVNGEKLNKELILLINNYAMYTINGLKDGQSYIFIATAVDQAGNESLPSKELVIKTSPQSEQEVTPEITPDKNTGKDKGGQSKLPRTGGLPVEVFYGFGALLAASGAVLTFRKKKAS